MSVKQIVIQAGKFMDLALTEQLLTPVLLASLLSLCPKSRTSSKPGVMLIWSSQEANGMRPGKCSSAFASQVKLKARRTSCIAVEVVGSRQSMQCLWIWALQQLLSLLRQNRGDPAESPQTPLISASMATKIQPCKRTSMHVVKICL